MGTQMDLYSKKQNWKLLFLSIAILMIAASLYFSNSIVKHASKKEQFRAKQWAENIKKKAELIQLTNKTFSEIFEKERFLNQLWGISVIENMTGSVELKIPVINQKLFSYEHDMPVILINLNEKEITATKNIAFLDKVESKLNKEDVFKDTLLEIAKSFPYKDTLTIPNAFKIVFAYGDSKKLVQLKHDYDSIIESFNKELISEYNNIPVLLIDIKTKKPIASNLPKNKISPLNLASTIAELAKNNTPISISLGNNKHQLLYYDMSSELKQLHYFPYIQFAMIILFVYIGYAIFNTFRKAEQNQVWAGMAKETAHQLGTPLSSLIGWVEYLENQDVDKSIPAEMKKDVDRLVKVADRFSKIGSETHLENSDLLITVNSVMTYLRPRISKKVEISVNASQHEIIVPYNSSLIEWVIENIAKNAVDAMENVGKLSIHLSQTEKETIIDFTDTGKGVAAQHFQKIFKPGFTSKKRGWGLGLSLVKRIINVYHKGNVFVLKSELNKGTTMRICLNNNTKD